jgi:hypothetical protein
MLTVGMGNGGDKGGGKAEMVVTYWWGRPQHRGSRMVGSTPEKRLVP